jgi:hypothetical protein
VAHENLIIIIIIIIFITFIIFIIISSVSLISSAPWFFRHLLCRELLTTITSLSCSHHCCRVQREWESFEALPPNRLVPTGGPLKWGKWCRWGRSYSRATQRLSLNAHSPSKQLCHEGYDTKHQVDAPAWPTSTVGPAFIGHRSHHLKSQHWFETALSLKWNKLNVTSVWLAYVILKAYLAWFGYLANVCQMLAGEAILNGGGGVVGAPIGYSR